MVSVKSLHADSVTGIGGYGEELNKLHIELILVLLLAGKSLQVDIINPGYYLISPGKIYMRL